jgi:dTDP-4-dehydrorhamnose 3,5-epimerase
VRVEVTTLPGVLRIEPEAFGDERGWFLETWRREHYTEYGIGPDFVQANSSQSARGVLRGLHFQWPEPQGKLVWVTSGRVLDVAVDIRPQSSHFGQWMACELDAESHAQLWIPPGFAHGFLVLSEQASFHYLCTAPYRAEFDAAIAWNDPDIGIDWPTDTPDLSPKDARAPRLADLSADQLPS